MLLLEILTHGKHNKPYAVATYIHVNGAICLGNCFGFQKERNRNDFSWQNFFENKTPNLEYNHISNSIYRHDLQNKVFRKL